MKKCYKKLNELIDAKTVQAYNLVELVSRLFQEISLVGDNRGLSVEHIYRVDGNSAVEASDRISEANRYVLVSVLFDELIEPVYVGRREIILFFTRPNLDKNRVGFNPVGAVV